MQLHFFLRGEYRAIRRFKEEMSAIYLDFQYEKDDGKGGFIPGTSINYRMQIILRETPFGIYEIVFPKQHMDLILTTVLGKKENNLENYKGYGKYILMFRKLLKLKKIPNYDNSKTLIILKNGIDIIPIGIKYDPTNADGHENI